MSLCPICGRVYCEHTSQERNQTSEEMIAPLTSDEERKTRETQAEETIDTILGNPKIAQMMDWKKMGNKIEGRNRVLVRHSNGKLEVKNK